MILRTEISFNESHDGTVSIVEYQAATKSYFLAIFTKLVFSVPLVRDCAAHGQSPKMVISWYIHHLYSPCSVDNELRSSTLVLSPSSLQASFKNADACEALCLSHVEVNNLTFNSCRETSPSTDCPTIPCVDLPSVDFRKLLCIYALWTYKVPKAPHSHVGDRILKMSGTSSDEIPERLCQ